MQLQYYVITGDSNKLCNGTTSHLVELRIHVMGQLLSLPFYSNLETIGSIKLRKTCLAHAWLVVKLKVAYVNIQTKPNQNDMALQQERIISPFQLFLLVLTGCKSAFLGISVHSGCKMKNSSWHFCPFEYSAVVHPIRKIFYLPLLNIYFVDKLRITQIIRHLDKLSFQH